MISLERINGPEWIRDYSELAHMAVFKKKKPAVFDRIDFALLTKRGDEIMTYVTCRENDHETIYWQFGGAFNGAKNSVSVMRSFTAMIENCKKDYKRIHFLVENTNLSMLRLAMSSGFRIMGVRAYRNSILLEHLLEFENE